MIPRLSPPFDWRDALALTSGFFSKGVEAFERAMGAYTGKRFALAFPYGRSGFYALIKVMGWQGRDIILPAFTCSVMADVVIHSGNKPRYADIGLDDFNMRPELVTQLVGPRTAAVIATHMYGFPMDLTEIHKSLTSCDHAAVVQDCALAMGAGPAGDAAWKSGLAALFSFSIGKHVSSVEGGMIVTDDTDLFRELRTFRDNHYTRPALSRSLAQALFFMAAWLGLTPPVYSLVHALATRTSLLDFLTVYQSEEGISIPSNLCEALPDCLGALGAAQMRKVEAVLAAKRTVAEQYRQALERAPGVRLPQPSPGASWSHFPCLVESRPEFLAFMLERGVHVGTEVFNYALPDMPVYADPHGPDCPNARRVASELALIPNHYRLGQRGTKKVVAALRAWSRRPGKETLRVRGC